MPSGIIMNVNLVTLNVCLVMLDMFPLVRLDTSVTWCITQVTSMLA